MPDRSSVSKATIVAAPHGFISTNSSKSSSGQQRAAIVGAAPLDLKAIKLTRAWAVAQSPAKSIFMNMFMAWMSGSSIGVFSIMVLGYMLYGPLQTIANIGATFKAYEDDGVSLALPKLVFVALNLGVVAVGLYKAHSLGLLQITDSDWAIYLPVKSPLIQTAG
jgi:ER membrane protein complex subunit 4